MRVAEAPRYYSAADSKKDTLFLPQWLTRLPVSFPLFFEDLELFTNISNVTT